MEYNTERPHSSSATETSFTAPGCDVNFLARICTKNQSGHEEELFTIRFSVQFPGGRGAVIERQESYK